MVGMGLLLEEDMIYTSAITATATLILIVGLAIHTTSTRPTSMLRVANKATRPWVEIQRGISSRLLRLRSSAWYSETSD